MYNIQQLTDKQKNIIVFQKEAQFFVFDYYRYALLRIPLRLYEIFSAIMNDLEWIYEKNAITKTELEFLNKLLDGGILDTGIKRESVVTEDKGYISMPTVHNCNLKCKYCFASAGENYTDCRREMNEDEVQKLFEFLFFEYFDDKKHLRLDFVSGGEPLLAFEKIKKIVRMRDDLYQKSSKYMEIWLCTNGTLLTEEICDFLNENNISIGISLDGYKEQHDKNRKFKNGKGSYDAIIKNIKMIQSNKCYTSKFKDIWGLAVIEPSTGSLIDILIHYRELGFKNVQMKLVRSEKEEFKLNMQNINGIKLKYTELAQFLFQQIKENGDTIYLQMILNDNDYFGKVIKRLLLKQHLICRCRAGKNKVAITANGDLYPCDSFVNFHEFKMGNVFEKDRIIDKNALGNVCSEQSKYCNMCWARYVCGGDCYYNAYLKNKDVLVPDRFFCDLQKHLIKEAIYLIYEISELNADYLERISRVCSYKEKISIL